MLIYIFYKFYKFYTWSSLHLTETSQTVQGQKKNQFKVLLSVQRNSCFGDIFSTLYPNSNHNNNYREKKDWGIYKHSALKIKENYQSHMKYHYNKNKFGEEEKSAFQYQAMK